MSKKKQPDHSSGDIDDLIFADEDYAVSSR